MKINNVWCEELDTHQCDFGLGDGCTQQPVAVLAIVNVLEHANDGTSADV